MAKEFIIAIELGSSKITGMAGKKNQDGSISILAVAQENSSAYIHKGIIYNHDRTVQCLTNIVHRLETTLKSKIASVYVGVGGQSLRSTKNTIIKELEPETLVNEIMINELMDTNFSTTYPEQELLDAVTQEYKVDNQYQLSPAGIQCTHLEGNFLNILWRKSFYTSLNKCFNSAGIRIVERYIAPIVLADSVLTENEKRSGCMLVDLGADTTTVSIYYKNILRHIAVVPLGSSNITKDLTSLQIDDDTAEKMKLKYGCAYTEDKDLNNNELPIDNDRSINNRKFIEVVEARVEEIVQNAWYQMPTEFADKIQQGGIILTGGGSNMKNIDVAFRKFTKMEKVRIAKFVNCTINSKLPEITAHDGRMNTVLALLERGNENCAGQEINDTLFGPDEVETGTPSTDEVKEPRTPGKGVIKSPEEKEAEERARQQKEEAERLAQQKEQEEQERKAKENSLFHKMGNKFKKFFNQMIEEEE